MGIMEYYTLLDEAIKAEEDLHAETESVPLDISMLKSKPETRLTRATFDRSTKGLSV